MGVPTAGASTLWNNAFSTSATSSAITTQASGSDFYVIFAESSAIDNGVTDSFGNTYTKQTLTPAASSSFGQIIGSVWVCLGGTGGSGHTFTAAWSSGSIIATIMAGEIKGALTSSAIDLLVGNGTNTGTSTSVPVSQGTTTSANEFVVSFALGSSAGVTESISGAGTFASIQNYAATGFYPPLAVTGLGFSSTGTYGDVFTGTVADEYASGTFSFIGASSASGVSVAWWK